MQALKIGTHDGRFHCDQVLACTMLLNYVGKFKDAQVIRSRDPKVWETCDVLVDVGGRYEPPRLLDHHQIQFKETYPGHGIRMSSAGLVYLHFPEIIPSILDEIEAAEATKLSFKPVRSAKIEQEIREKIYKHFIVYVDANDNGVDKIEDKDVGLVPTTLWARVAKQNPMWYEESPQEFELFTRSMQIVRQQLYSEVKQAYLGSLQTKQIVEEAFRRRKEVHPSGKMFILEKYVPWQKPLLQLEEQENCVGEVLYVIFPEKGNKKWRVQAVPAKEGSFELRKGLKQEWRGVKDMEKLVAASGIPDIDFVHASGFIGGACSKQSAVRMGELSL